MTTSLVHFDNDIDDDVGNVWSLAGSGSTYVAGQFAEAIDFDGNGAAVVPTGGVQGHTMYRSSAASVVDTTLEFWVRMSLPASGSGTNPNIMTQVANAGDNLVFNVPRDGETDAGKLRVYQDQAGAGGVGNFLVSDAVVADGQWHYVVFQHMVTGHSSGQTHAALWVDGVYGIAGSVTYDDFEWTNVTDFAFAEFSIGAKSVASVLSQGMTGSIDEFRFTESALYSGDTIPVPTAPFEFFVDGVLKLRNQDNTGWIDVLPRMKWVYPYVLGPEYPRMTVVNDGGWLVCSNKLTSERAAPQAIGSVSYYLDAVPPTWATGNFSASSLRVANSYVQAASTVVSNMRVYIPSTNPDIAYSGKLNVNGDDVLVGGQFTAQDVISQGFTVPGWVNVTIPNQVLASGDTITPILEAQSTATVTPLTATWEIISSQQLQPAADGEWSIRSIPTGLWNIAKVDSSFTDHSAYFAGLASGDTIEVNSIVYTIQTITDSGQYIQVQVNPLVNPPAGFQSAEFLSYDAATIDYVIDLAYWTDNPPASGSASGYYQIDGGAIVASDAAFGADITTQQVSISEDWDVMMEPSNL